MKTLKHLTPVVALLGLCLWIPAAWAQPDPQARPRDRVGRVVAPDRPRGNLDPMALSSVGRPSRPEYNELPLEVRQKIERFKSEARAYLDRQEALRKQLSGVTTDAERDRIREQLNNLRDQWLERARTLREEFRERRGELLNRLPGHREVLDDAKDNLRDKHHPRDTR